MSSNLLNFWPLNIYERCSNFIQIAPSNPGNSSNHIYHAQNCKMDMVYLGKVKMVLSSHMGSINFVDQKSTWWTNESGKNWNYTY